MAAKTAMERLVEVGTAMARQKNLPVLLEMILMHARELSGCDAASLYLVNQEGDSSGDIEGARLFFMLTHNDSVDVPFQKTTIPITKESLAGYVAITRETVNLGDVSKIPAGAPYKINRRFDMSSGYNTISMLTMPMEDRQGNLSGVIQLINRRKNPKKALGKGCSPKDVLAFDKGSERVVGALSAQAAVAIENSKLYQSITGLFDAVVHASVSAIEARDPTTSGHSERVSQLTGAFALAVDQEMSGPYAWATYGPDQIREIEFASLLHDFGKIGVREEVLIKAKKLYPHELASIEQRWQIAGLGYRLRAAQEKLTALGKRAKGEETFDKIEKQLDMELKDLEGKIKIVREANNPSLLPEETSTKIKELAEEPVSLPGCDILTMLNHEEAEKLGIRRGSLTPEERKEIERHVTHTYEFLKRIPWTKDLKRVPEIAYAHHEKMDGTGYPRKLKGHEIPVETRMMTICDIYDALTAWDRPYKKAISPEIAIKILEDEAARGALDAELLKIFIEGRVFTVVDRSRAGT